MIKFFSTKQTTFKRLLSASELKISEKDKEILKKMGLTRHEVDGKVYFVFNGTGAMYRALPFAS